MPPERSVDVPIARSEPRSEPRARRRSLLIAGLGVVTGAARRIACVTGALALATAVAAGAPAFADEAAPGNGGQPPLPTVTMAIGEHALSVELAIEPEQRYLGLGNRRTLAESAAMLFVYPDERPLTFTMRDTLLPLSIAFIDDSLTILQIVDMNVGPGQLFPSELPARYALEVNQGWFAQRDIEPGAQLTLVDGTLR